MIEFDARHGDTACCLFVWRYGLCPGTIDLMQLIVLNLKTMTHTRLTSTRLPTWVRRLLLGAALLIALGVSGCATTASRALSADLTASAVSQDLDVPAADRTAQFQILAGEMAIQRGMPKVAAQHYVSALQYTSNKQLARRATRIAVYAELPKLAYEAAQHWARLAPDMLDAQRTATRLALTQGDAQKLPHYSRAVLALADSRDEGYLMLADLLSGRPEHGELAINALQQLVQADAKRASAW